MAETKRSQTGTTRRVFITAAVAAAAGAALPAAGREASRRPTWTEFRALLPALRAAYLEEIARFAATLRPRFESGELRGNISSDWDEALDHGTDTPMDRLEALCEQHFDLENTETERLVLLVSPSADESNDAVFYAAYDVLTCARSHGWAPLAENA